METRTPGLSRKSASTLSLINDVDMEVESNVKPFKFITRPKDRVKELEEMLTEQRRMLQKQTDRIAELEEDNNIYAEEVSQSVR